MLVGSRRSLLPSRKSSSIISETETIFNGSDKGAGITISGASNKIITKGIDSWSGVAAGGTNVRKTGARYFEVQINVSATNNGIAVWLVDAAEVIASLHDMYAGGSSTIFAGYYSDGSMQSYGGNATPASGTRWWDGVSAYSKTGPGAPVAGDYISVAVDITNGKLWLGRNNVWTGSLTPVVNGAYGFIDRIPQISAGYKIAVGIYYNTYQATLRTKTSEFSGTVPAGFTAWDIGV